MVDLALILVLGSIVAAVLIGGCLNDDPAPEQDQVIRTISPAEASALIDTMGQSPEFVIIDVRRPDEFAGGHVPGAINIDSADFSEHLASLDQHGTYVIYCRGGVRSTSVREQMREAGFREVYEIEGGINAWEAAGLPVVRG